MIINLTPHNISVYSMDSCEEITKGSYKSLVLKEGATPMMVLPSEGVARASAIKQTVDTINGIPVNATSYGEVEGLPEEAKDTFYVVSALTAQAAPSRRDLLIVDGTVRNDAGQIVGCTAFGRI